MSRGWYETPIGRLVIESDGDFLTGVFFSARDAGTEDPDPLIDRAKRWLDIYFSGKDPGFVLPLERKGSAFSLIVRDIVRQIPYGKTMSYMEVAQMSALVLGKERMASQAVGQALRRIPFEILVPCHRVIGKDGAVQGFGDSGQDRKIWLLRHENPSVEIRA